MALCEWFGKDPYDWQFDVAEAILSGLDSVIIASTGAGKTMPFMMPLMLNKSKKVIIVLSLKILQVDQVWDILILIWCNLFLLVEWFKKMQIETAAVDGATLIPNVFITVKTCLTDVSKLLPWKSSYKIRVFWTLMASPMSGSSSISDCVSLSSPR